MRIESVMWIESLFENNPERIEKTIGNCKIIYHVYHDKELIDLVSIRVPQNKRKQGFGREGMEYITNKADQLSYKISLLASPLDKKTDVGKLVNFYRNFGFEVTNRRNMAGEPYMSREPQ